MLHDNNNSPSYEHMMGSPKRAHEGSQSSSPEPMKAPAGKHMTKSSMSVEKAHKT